MSDTAPRRVSAWRRWRALPAPERRLALFLFFLLPAVAAALSLLGVRRVCRVLGRLASRRARLKPCPASAGAPHLAAADARHLARLVDAAARRLPGHPACLTRSVTLWYLLRRRALPAALRLGVRKAEGRLEAHAWVELGGEVVNDSADVGARFPAFELEDFGGFASLP